MNKSNKDKYKILFAVRAVEHYAYIKSAIESLNRRGHQIRVVFDKRCSLFKIDDLDKVKIRSVDYDWAKYSQSKWRKIPYWARDLLSYRRYLIVRGQSDYYRERWTIFLPFFIRFFLKTGFFDSFLKTGLAGFLVGFFERITPPEPEIIADIKSFDPDVVVATPGNLPFTSCDVEYLKAAKSLKIPTVLPVFSWDNLTTKGLFHAKPDIVLAWNRTQELEAKIHHNFPADKIKIIGSPLLDFWFSYKKPPITREYFCKKYGLTFNKRILLYLGSAESITGDEGDLVREIAVMVNNSKDSQVRNLQIVVRPHPNNKAFDNFKLDNVWVIPKKGSLPNAKKDTDLYFETIYFSDVVVGVNTTGLIDAIICDRPVVSPLVAQYQKTQIETEHFRHLVEKDVIEIAEVNGELVGVLEDIFRGGDKHKKQRSDFINDFIRPKDLNKSAGEWGAEEIEELAQDKI